MASILVYKYAYICTCIEFCNYALSSNLVVDKIFLNKYTYICRTYMFNVIKPLNNLAVELHVASTFTVLFYLAHRCAEGQVSL